MKTSVEKKIKSMASYNSSTVANDNT